MNRRRRIVLLAAAVAAVPLIGTPLLWAHADATVAADPTRSPAVGRGYTVWSHVTPRVQWEANFGYCGETSLILAGLRHGQYVSQYDARAIASPGVPQDRRGSQLLLGVNDTRAANTLRLTSSTWSNPRGSSTAGFLTWVKQRVVAGDTVTIGVYTNENRFFGSDDPAAGDEQYDHIVTVLGLTSRHPLTDARYFPDDRLMFTDHGLWNPGGTPRLSFTSTFAAFPASRSDANSPDAPVYSLAATGPHFALAVSGPADPGHVTLPVTLDVSPRHETPDMVDGTTARPASSPLTLTATVTGLTPGRSYRLYRYDAATAVPTSAFNSSGAAASRTWEFTATGPSYALTETVRSSDQVFYRAVPSTAP